MGHSDGFPASFYGEPGVLGLLANGISAFLVLLQNFNSARTGVAPLGVENILAGVHIILIGGVSQLVADLPPSTVSQLPDVLFYLTNGVAALSAVHNSHSSSTFLHLSLPWVLVSGAIMQAFVSRLQAQGGRWFRPVIAFAFAAIWATWTWYRFAGFLLDVTPASAQGFTAGAIAFLIVNGFLMLTAAYGNLVLLALTALMEVLLVCFLLSTLDKLPYKLEIAMLAIFSIVCLYGMLGSLANAIFSKDMLPLGPPVLKVLQKRTEEMPPAPCPLANSRLTSGLLTIAKLLDTGRVCGIPTDTVYALAASCRHPEAKERIYNIKVRPSKLPWVTKTQALHSTRTDSNIISMATTYTNMYLNAYLIPMCF
ncbi:uncharacterized protein LOC136711448 [Amia ocellicauda]|uniref:uncharacterized protein LOC136711448 n=1 Tax=Amia ocellicauda TaxID=2972642 RepID=UPI0034646DD0